MISKEEEAIDRILKEFYIHAAGTDDYGCEACIKTRNELVDLLRGNNGKAREKAGTAQNRLTITDVAKRLNISTKTIVRWEKAGKIDRAKRDWRGWRIFQEEDINKFWGILYP
jgi:excisionase family DNA binding protein